jgi:hypothetical protein
MGTSGRLRTFAHRPRGRRDPLPSRDAAPFPCRVVTSGPRDAWLAILFIDHEEAAGRISQNTSIRGRGAG